MTTPICYLLLLLQVAAVCTMLASGCPAGSHYPYYVLFCPTCMWLLYILCCFLAILHVATTPVAFLCLLLWVTKQQKTNTPATLSKSLIRALDYAVVPIGIQRNAAVFIVVITPSGMGLCHTSLSCVAIQVWHCHRCHKWKKNAHCMMLWWYITDVWSVWMYLHRTVIVNK